MMKKILVIIVSVFVITACGNSPEESTKQTTATQTIPSTSTVAITSTPTITPTPSPTPIPTSTSTPEVMQFGLTTVDQLSKLTPENYVEAFTPVTQMVFDELIDAPPRQNIVYDDETPPVIVSPQSNKLVLISGLTDVNLFLQQGVLLNINGYDHLVLMYKIITPDENGHNTIKPLNICFEPLPGEDITRVIQHMDRFTQTRGISMFIMFQNQEYLKAIPEFFEPVMGSSVVRDQLGKDGIIDGDIGTVLLFSRGVQPFDP